MKPPADFTSGAWVGTLEAAAYFRRSQREIQRWCENGTLRGVGAWKDLGGRWWVKVGFDIIDRDKRDKGGIKSLTA